jgi:alpha-tubulin suppressor-like RCC1 family protein
MKTFRINPAHLLFPLVFLAFVGCTPNAGTRTAPAPQTAAAETGNPTAIPTWTLPPQKMSLPTSTATLTPSFSPTPAFTATAIAAGRRHTCVLTDRNRVKCWGENEDGQLGDGTTIRKSTATDVAGLDEDVREIAAGYNHTCALTAGGGVKCWGNNAFYQLGDNTQTSRSMPVDVPLPEKMIAVSAGTLHTCATTGRDVYCWGIVGYQLLEGVDVITIAHKPYRIDLSNIPGNERITAIGSGFDHDCVLTDAGFVYCWGRNDLGQLGWGMETYSSIVPEKVVGLTGPVSRMAVGGSHTCVIIEDGSVMCWGYNNAGQLGQLNNHTSSVALKVPDLPEATEISAGAYHTCVKVGGGAMCWGDNRFGQLGRFPPIPGEIIVVVTGLPGRVQLISAGASHTCVLVENGGVVCWGNNKYNQLGDYPAVPAPMNTPMPTQTETEGTQPSTPVPSSTPPVSNKASSIAAGHSHTCAVTGSGGVKCWGKNEHGELGNGTFNASLVPVDVTGLRTGVRSVVAGWGHTCALTTSGGVKCWGYNQNGELGNGTNTKSNIPVDVRGLSSGVKSLEAGDDHTCALMESGQVKCWGFNEYGQLGDGTAVDRNAPVDVQGIIPPVVAVAAGWGHTCALTDQGAVKCWGNNHYGQVGDGSSIENLHTPVNVAGLAYGVAAISADGGHTCALLARGVLECWGNNKYGQLGDGTAEVREVPVPVVGLTTDIAKVVAGWNHTCVVKGSGDVVCWGWNYYGQLGNGIRTTSTRPTDAGELASGVTDLALGWGHTCAITDSGGVQCWGLNDKGQVGDDSTSDAFLPIDVVGLEGRR